MGLVRANTANPADDLTLRRRQVFHRSIVAIICARLAGIFFPANIWACAVLKPGTSVLKVWVDGV